MRNTAFILAMLLLVATHQDSYITQPAVFGAMCATLVCYRLASKYRLSVALLAGYVTVNFFYSYVFPPEQAAKVILSMSFWQAWRAVTVVIIAFAACTIKIDTMRLLRWLSVVNIGLAAYTRATDNHDQFGIIFNPSFNAAFTVWLLPSWVGNRHCWLACIGTIAALLLQVGHGAMGYVLLGLYGLLAAVHYRRAWIAFAAMLALSLAHLTGYLPMVAFDESSRWAMYGNVIRYLWSDGKLVFGEGFGSFPAIGYLLQQKYNLPDQELWLSLHNDWLQMLFECGLIGLGLMVWVFIDVLLRLKGHSEKALWLGLGLVACFVFPLQLPIWLFLTVMVAQPGMRLPERR